MQVITMMDDELCNIMRASGWLSKMRTACKRFKHIFDAECPNRRFACVASVADNGNRWVVSSIDDITSTDRCAQFTYKNVEPDVRTHEKGHRTENGTYLVPILPNSDWITALRFERCVPISIHYGNRSDDNIIPLSAVFNGAYNDTTRTLSLLLPIVTFTGFNTRGYSSTDFWVSVRVDDGASDDDVVVATSAIMTHDRLRCFHLFWATRIDFDLFPGSIDAAYVGTVIDGDVSIKCTRAQPCLQ